MQSHTQAHPRDTDQQTADLADAVAVAVNPETEVTTPMGRKDGGDLYGVRTPPASDRELPDDDEAQGDGQNWIEALAEASIEGGPEPEGEVDVVDEDDIVTPHSTENQDRPLADRGSAGPRGM